MDPILKALAVGLAVPAQPPAEAPAPAFAAKGQMPLDALQLTVAGHGPLDRPVTPDAACALHQASTPAPYGRREQTLLDTRVRDTGEIGAEALELQWADGARAALEAEAARVLGLRHLQARVHKLLIYGPGQFFKPHQDTEKHDGMVATLVLVWPSAHIGGDLVVRHGDQQARFASQHLQAGALRWFVSYADCRHEVLPVQEGWRIVLTFDLVVMDAAPSEAPVSPAVVAALRERFDGAEGPSLSPWVFLLDHEYSPRGLRWSLLKGLDQPRVAALRAAALHLGLDLHLALCKIHEQWTAVPGGRSRRSAGGDDDMERDELIDSEVELEHWVAADGRQLQGQALAISERDLCSYSETDETFLVNEDYEGYMGNYGETLEYWYCRAALVIQTPLAAQASRFSTDFDAAIRDARELARQGRGAELASRLTAAAGALRHHLQGRGLAVFPDYAELALALPEAGQAHDLLRTLDWVVLTPDEAPVLARLIGRWGLPWWQALVQAWMPAESPWASLRWVNPVGGGEGKRPWPQPLAAFLSAGLGAGWPAPAGDLLLQHALGILAVSARDADRGEPAARLASQPRRLQAAGDWVRALGTSSPCDAHLVALVQQLRAHPRAYPVLDIAPVVVDLMAVAGGASAPVSDLSADVQAALAQALAAPERPDTDRSLEGIDWVCHCADCQPVAVWAQSPAASPLILAIAETRRRHVQDRLKAAAAPLSAQTLKQGSPHKLVLSKPDDWPSQRRARRQAWAQALQTLQEATGG